MTTRKAHLQHQALVHQVPALLLQLRPQAAQLPLVLAQQRAVVQVLIDLAEYSSRGRGRKRVSCSSSAWRPGPRSALGLHCMCIAASMLPNSWPAPPAPRRPTATPALGKLRMHLARLANLRVDSDSAVRVGEQALGCMCSHHRFNRQGGSVHSPLPPPQSSRWSPISPCSLLGKATPCTLPRTSKCLYRRRHHSHKGGAAVAAQAVFQDACQLGVPGELVVVGKRQRKGHVA